MPVWPQQHLLVLGGGKRPPEAMKRFVEWSGGQKAKILVITWATGLPDESFEALKNDLSSFQIGVEHAATRPLDHQNAHSSSNNLKMPRASFFRAATKTA
ncbi:MAG: hypothetical protein ABR530_01615 [Pyrinomonadaceae bacterium]